MLNFETKPIIAMLHLKGNSDEEIMERMKKETEIYYRNGVDAVLAKQRCDAVVTTGEGTGKDCPTEKLVEFRSVLSDFPLIVGAGVTADNVCEKLQFADGVIIGSWLKDGHHDYGDVCVAYVKEFMDRVREFHR